MTKLNCQRKSCRDVFNAFMVKNADYAGIYELPVLLPTYEIPNRLISFTEALKSKNYNAWIHFYQDDCRFIKVWREAKRYLKLFKRFRGLILPDFSVYRDMPFVMQISNIYCSRAIGHWLQSEGIKIIPNLRYGDERTYEICCNGIAKNSVIAVGSYGTLKVKEDRFYFLNGLDKVVEILKPSAIVVYGSAPNKYFQKYKDMGIKIYQFDSDFVKSHNKGVK